MHSSVASFSMVLPLQVICIFMILVGAHSSGQVAKPGCRDRCGNLSIPYPFGIGSDCSLDPSFYISCNTSTDPPEAYLSAIDKHLQVLEINQTYVRVKYPILVSVCYDLSAYEPGTDSSNLTTPQSYKHSMTVDLSGTPYSLSIANSITAIGCDDMVFGIDQLKDSYLTGGCSAICTDSGITDGHGVGFCPVNDTLIGNGCCRAPIFGALTVKDKYSLGAELVDLSSKLARRKLFPCSYAFIQEEIPNATVFSYPLHYLHNATAFLDDNWASASRPPVVRLDWSFGSENCSRAQLNSTTYACRDNKSVCVDEVDDYLITTGYICRCVQGYEGNPYLPGGCKPISFSSSVAKPGCQDQCGKLSIPFPFGMGPNCFLAPSFELICNTSTNPPIAYLSILNTEIIELNSSKVSVKYPNQPGYVCYNYSDYSRVSKTEERSLMIDLSTTQYTLSGENSITAVGCDDMLVGVIGQGNRSFMGSACASVCSDRRDSIIRGELIQDAAFCPSVESPGDGCCRAPIPPGTSYLEANLMDISGEWPVVNFSCSYAFFQLNRNPEPNLSPQIQRLSIYNSTEVLMENEGEIELALDWRVGNLNCKQAQLVNSTSFACQANTDCIDFDATTTVGGYLCNCSRGFQGNPYLASGCQDIDECADNPCVPNAICSNTIGSFYCSCKKGYFGDGTKDGKGCIQRPETKTIILIGMGSGLGFLLILVMLFWLYKLLQKRRAIMLREKFFKRNGGLLLRQQTNEGALGKTKVFPSKELEIATDNFNESRILGQGGQGTVYKGMLSDGKIVAVKKSKLVEENQLEQFINEVVILSQINHRNVVQLLGCCLETEVPLLVYEFMPNGTLYELIHDPNNEFAIPWNMRLKIAADIAGALAYLHSASSMPIYHRDIKSSNILLDEKYVVKVSDFGTSRSVDVDQTHLTTLVKGTFGYLDPEYFQSSRFTEKSDVYSFGVVLVELLTGQKPISFDKTEEERGLATRFLTCMEHNCLDTILDPQVSEQGRKEEVTIVARLAQRCLHLKGKMRPTMKEVANELESLRISQMSTIANNETEDVSGFEGIPMTISDGAYTWTGSYNSVVGSLSSDTHPLTFATM